MLIKINDELILRSKDILFIYQKKSNELEIRYIGSAGDLNTAVVNFNQVMTDQLKSDHGFIQLNLTAVDNSLSKTPITIYTNPENIGELSTSGRYNYIEVSSGVGNKWFRYRHCVAESPSEMLAMVNSGGVKNEPPKDVLINRSKPKMIP